MGLKAFVQHRKAETELASLLPRNAGTSEKNENTAENISTRYEFNKNRLSGI